MIEAVEVKISAASKKSPLFAIFLASELMYLCKLKIRNSFSSFFSEVKILSTIKFILSSRSRESSYLSKILYSSRAVIKYMLKNLI